jgi:hypothetical protein
MTTVNVPRIRAFSLPIFPMLDINSPESLLLSRYKPSKFVSPDQDSGMVPVRWFCPSARASKLIMLPHELGRGPLKALLSEDDKKA